MDTFSRCLCLWIQGDFITNKPLFGLPVQLKAHLLKKVIRSKSRSSLAKMCDTIYTFLSALVHSNTKRLGQVPGLMFLFFLKIKKYKINSQAFEIMMYAWFFAENWGSKTRLVPAVSPRDLDHRNTQCQEHSWKRMKRQVDKQKLILHQDSVISHDVFMAGFSWQLFSKPTPSRLDQ